jgi:hypothetical protein
MRLFQCQACRNVVNFENTSCERCHRQLAYLPEIGTISAVEPAGDNWIALVQRDQPRRPCTNAEHNACNWLVPPDSNESYCLACRHNGTIPDISNPANLSAWQRIEFAKHRLIYSLLRWQLPLLNQVDDPEHGLAFHFLADQPAGAGPKVLTGHDNGVVTVALAEADDVEREKRRSQMREPYRTLLGHFRHEVGHHYWDLLVRDGGKLDACRSLFGDDTLDYQAALERHYAQGAASNWQDNFISAYATTHPWEDFAETWAHYIHIVDTLEAASSFGMAIKPRLDTVGTLSARIDFDPYEATDMKQIIAAWLPFVFAMNAVSRAMGQPDLYPFVLAQMVFQKLEFIHKLIHRQI